MALETQVISTQEIKPMFAFDTDAQALGTAHTSDDDYVTLPVISYTMPYNSSPLDVAPTLAGNYGQLENQGKHRPDLSTWNYDVTFLGTNSAIRANCLWAFGDASTPMALTPAIGIGNGVAGDMQMKHDTASNNHTTAIFQNGGTDAAIEDLIVKGSIIQSMTLKQDVTANAGQLTIDSTFFTAYVPHEANAAEGGGGDDITSDSTDTGTPKSIFDLDTGTNGKGCIGLGGQLLQPTSWEITISRPLARIGFNPEASNIPYGYAQTGAWEVTGSLNVKADNNTYDIIDKMQGDSAGMNLSIDGADGFTIDCPDVMVDTAALEKGDTHLTHTIPFRVFAGTATADIISITFS